LFWCLEDPAFGTSSEGFRSFTGDVLFEDADSELVDESTPVVDGGEPTTVVFSSLLRLLAIAFARSSSFRETVSTSSSSSGTDVTVISGMTPSGSPGTAGGCDMVITEDVDTGLPEVSAQSPERMASKNGEAKYRISLCALPSTHEHGRYRPWPVSATNPPKRRRLHNDLDRARKRRVLPERLVHLDHAARAVLDMQLRHVRLIRIKLLERPGRAAHGRRAEDARCSGMRLNRARQRRRRAGARVSGDQDMGWIQRRHCLWSRGRLLQYLHAAVLATALHDGQSFVETNLIASISTEAYRSD
jgi:hypothetical protein